MNLRKMLSAQNSFVFIYLINCFTNLTDLATALSQFAGYVQRFSLFLFSRKRFSVPRQRTQ